MAIVSFVFNLLCGAWHDDDAGVWVSHCPRLNVYSQGTTEDEARTAIKESVGLYVKVCYERGLLNEVLQKAGFTRLAEGETSPLQVEDAEFVLIRQHKVEPFRISVPVHLIAEQQRLAAECLQ